MNDLLKDLRDWMFRRLTFEAEAEQFRKAGIRIGADLSDVESTLLEEVLSPFSVALRNDALQMTRLYTILYCFENSVRELVRERLQEKYGVEWWNKGVSLRIKELAKKRKLKVQENSWLDAGKSDFLHFVEFGDLADIIISNDNWDIFTDLIPSQHWIKQRMDELEHARNFVAHNRLLLPAEFRRIEMYIADWNKMVGL